MWDFKFFKCSPYIPLSIPIICVAIYVWEYFTFFFFFNINSVVEFRFNFLLLGFLFSLFFSFQTPLLLLYSQCFTDLFIYHHFMLPLWRDCIYKNIAGAVIRYACVSQSVFIIALYYIIKPIMYIYSLYYSVLF